MMTVMVVVLMLQGNPKKGVVRFAGLSTDYGYLLESLVQSCHSEQFYGYRRETRKHPCSVPSPAIQKVPFFVWDTLYY